MAEAKSRGVDVNDLEIPGIEVFLESDSKEPIYSLKDIDTHVKQSLRHPQPKSEE